MATTRVPLAKLPISPHAPIYHLPPDPLFPSPSSLLALSSYEPTESLQNGLAQLKEGDPMPPSMLRRSRMIGNGGAFTYVSPLPLEFPYNIQEEDPSDESEEGMPAAPASIEAVLAEYEVDPACVQSDGSLASKKRLSPKYPQPRLLCFSERCAEEWLPNLDHKSPDAKGALVDILGGKTVVARDGEAEPGKGFAPWSLCYGGHQFGSWAGQLGDGRAISIMSTPTTDDVKEKKGYHTIELQLKGAGRTPYSRFADGLAVLRSSIREFLGAETLAALKLPTSRALALVGLPDVEVRREVMERAAIVTRLAPSWIRIGNFEIQKSRQEWKTLYRLVRYVASSVLSLGPGAGAEDVVQEVSRRNAIMIAGWQAYGFMHGVMNSDNISVLGQCIDYGPYAFMDAFDPFHICNHSDDLGRYSYRNQPTMGLYAISKLIEALSELIGAEAELGLEAVQIDWAENADEEKLTSWRERGQKAMEGWKDQFESVFRKEYERLMRLRLGLSTAQDSDFDLVSSLLDLLQAHELDYNNSFRRLSQFTPQRTDESISLLAGDDLDIAHKADWKKWLQRYEERLSVTGEDAQSRRSRMDAVNPRFVLRQWVLEETIKEAEAGKTEQLQRVLAMAEEPFESYGEKVLGVDGSDSCPSKEESERQRLCGVGPKDMLGFQCSCSS